MSVASILMQRALESTHTFFPKEVHDLHVSPSFRSVSEAVSWIYSALIDSKFVSNDQLRLLSVVRIFTFQFVVTQSSSLKHFEKGRTAEKDLEYHHELSCVQVDDKYQKNNKFGEYVNLNVLRSKVVEIVSQVYIRFR